jgi:hypothetical protein
VDEPDEPDDDEPPLLDAPLPDEDRAGAPPTLERGAASPEPALAEPRVYPRPGTMRPPGAEVAGCTITVAGR